MLFVKKRRAGKEKRSWERKGRRGVVKCGSFAKKRGGVGSVTAGHAGLGLRLAAEVAAGRRLAAHDDLRPRADQRVRGVSVLQHRFEARAAVAAHAQRSEPL